MGEVLTINSGATVNTSVPHFLGWNATNNDLVINGGTLNIGADFYANSVTMTGGLITGGPNDGIRDTFGNFIIKSNAAATPAIYDVNFESISGDRWVFDVADGAASNDFIMNGQIPSVFIPVDKLGPGTLQMNGDMLHTQETYIQEGTFLLNGNLNTGNNIHVGNVSGQTATLQINSGSVTRGQVLMGENGGIGHTSLEGGTLRTNAVSMEGASTFNWGAGEFTMATANANASNGMVDFGEVGNAGPSVREGSIINITGDLTTTADSVLTLGNIYFNDGKRFDSMVLTGDLDLSAVGDTLNAIESLYFLRSIDGSSSDVGTLPLITAGSITGTFKNWDAPLTDGIGYEEFTGSFTTAAALPVNTWYLEYTADQVLLHYRLIGAVPEPGTLGFVFAGILLFRGLKDNRRRSQP